MSDDSPSSEREKVLLCLVLGLLREHLSPDMRYMGLRWGLKRAVEAGVDRELALDITQRVSDWRHVNRQPLDGMF